MGRKAFDFSKYVHTINKDKQQRKCRLCDHEFYGNGTRVKAHLYGQPGKGVRVCSESKQFLQELKGSNEGTEGSNKRAKGSTNEASISNSNKRAKTKTIAIASEQGLQDLGFPINHNTHCEDKVDKETVQEFPRQLVGQNKETKEKELLPIHGAEKLHFQVGPFSISLSVEADDQKLIKYVFSLRPSERVVSIGDYHLTQSDFTTLKPRTWLGSQVIEVVVRSLTNTERKKQNKLLNWYLPISFSNSALESDEESFKDFVERHIRRTFMSKLADCEKMFIPIRSDKHFYLYVVDMEKKKVRIWDSLPWLSSIDIEKRKEKGKNILLALDSLFAIDINNGWKFEEFDIEMAEDIPSQSNGYDCGIFVVKYIKSAADMTNLNTEFQSDEERLTLALSLLKDDMNTDKERISLESKKPYHEESDALPSIPEQPVPQGIGDSNCSLEAWELLSSEENGTRKRPEKAGLDGKLQSSVAKQRNNQIFSKEEEGKSVAADASTLSWKQLYQRAKDGDLKSIGASLECEQYFLHSVFYLGKREIRREELIRYFLDEGLINEMSLVEQFDEGHTILDKFEKQGLLEGGSFNMEDLYQEEDDVWLKGGIVDPEVTWVKIRGDKWDKAISMMRERSEFMVEADLGLTQIPYERNWSSVKKVSFICNLIKTIPRGNSLKCPELSTLILQRNPLDKIPDNFFSDMPALQVLDLSYTHVQNLPKSISNLTSLSSLLLKSCGRLDSVPPLDKLTCLRRLDLSRTAIMDIPEGLEKLVNITWLSFFKCEKLDMKPGRLIPKLTNLQYLELDFNRSRFMKVHAEDLKGLNKLETFAGNLSSVQDFNNYVHSIQDKDHRPKNYLLQLGTGNPWDPTFGRAVIFVNCDIFTRRLILQLPRDVEQLYIAECHRWLCVCDDLSFNTTTLLKYINIFLCDRLENFCCSRDNCNFCSSLQSLESLHLACLHNLRYLWREIDAPSFTLSRLRRLKVADCSSIRKLFTHQMLEKLPNLEKIRVMDCDSMEEIFSVTGGEDMGEPSSLGNSLRPTFFFPKLVSLELLNLPQLTSVCAGTMKFERLQEFRIGGCPQLIDVPDTEPSVNIIIDL